MEQHKEAANDEQLSIQLERGSKSHYSQDLPTQEGKITQKRDSSCLEVDSTMVMYTEPNKEADHDRQTSFKPARGLATGSAKPSKLPSAKKGKRFCPYGTHPSKLLSTDNSQLVEIPVTEEKNSATWALVASPNKPPTQS